MAGTDMSANEIICLIEDVTFRATHYSVACKKTFNSTIEVDLKDTRKVILNDTTFVFKPNACWCLQDGCSMSSQIE